MHKVKTHLFSLLTILCLTHTSAWACSVGKITSNGITWFGNNEDNWRTNPKIQFVTGKDGEFGAAFFLFEDLAPQGGINTEGLAFDGLTVHRQQRTRGQSLAHFGSNSEFLRYALHHFSNVDEVYHYMTERNMSLSNRGMFVFSDRLGKMLIAEPDTLILIDDPDFLIANYCPSQTDETERLEFARYRRGSEFLHDKNNKRDSTSCMMLMQAMHENRPVHHDGTLYTFVADLNNQIIQIAFYHDYSKWHQIDLHEELLKGNHKLDISQWFPVNQDYQHLQEYQTSFNSNPIRFYLVFLAIFSFILLITQLRFSIRKSESRMVSILSALFCVTMIANAYHFITNQSLFYMAPSLFSAIGKNGWTEVSIAFLSVILALCLIILIYRNRDKSADRRIPLIPALQVAASLPFFILLFYWDILY